MVNTIINRLYTMINELFIIINQFYIIVNNLYVYINKLFTKKDIFLIIFKMDMMLTKNLKLGLFFSYKSRPCHA